MKTIIDKASVPPGRAWTYIDPETSYRLSHPYYKVLLNQAKAYRQANNLPIGSNFNEQFDQILCNNLPGACMDFTPPTAFDKAASLTKASLNWAKAGFKTRSPEEAQTILTICQGCPYYGGESGLLKVVCKLCGCSRKKIYMRGQVCPDNPPRWS